MRNLLISISVALVLVTSGAAFAGTNEFEGIVKDFKGRAVRGAEIQITQDGKMISKTRSDADGRYASGPLPAGKYKLDLFVHSVHLATLPNGKMRASGPTEVNFELPGRRLWVVDTGTSIGRWVYLDDPNSRVSMYQLYRTDASYLQRMQDRTAGAQHPEYFSGY